MTPDLSDLPDATALVVNVVLVLGVVIATVRGWFSPEGRATRRRDGSADRPERGGDNAMLQMLATVLADRSATANLAAAARDAATALDGIARSIDRIERKVSPRGHS